MPRWSPTGPSPLSIQPLIGHLVGYRAQKGPLNFLAAGLAHEEVVSSLERFAKEVMPRFQADDD